MSQRPRKLTAIWTIPDLAQCRKRALESTNLVPLVPLPPEADDLRIHMQIFGYDIHMTRYEIYVNLNVLGKESVSGFVYDYELTAFSTTSATPASYSTIHYGCHQSTKVVAIDDDRWPMDSGLPHHFYVPKSSGNELTVRLVISYNGSDLIETAIAGRKRQAKHQACLSLSPSLNLPDASIMNDEATSDRLFRIYRKSLYTNLTLSVSASEGTESRDFRVNRQILASRCPLFDKMFGRNGRFVEASRDKVTIRDVPSIEAYDHFLAFLYSGRVLADEPDSVIGLLILADLYQMDPLKQLCEDYLQAQLTSVAICMEMLPYADLYSANRLQEAILEYFVRCYKNPSLLSRSEWKEFDANILQQNALLRRMLTFSVNEPLETRQELSIKTVSPDSSK